MLEALRIEIYTKEKRKENKKGFLLGAKKKAFYCENYVHNFSSLYGN